ncbi:MAG: D-glycerate dehydrogenase [Elusimicrobia bacterium]|nr:D-glycerate dehydrogenase [Elusimicrobiota bacterium]
MNRAAPAGGGKPRVLVTRNIPAQSLALLAPHFEVDYRDRATPIPRSEFLRRARAADAVLCLLTERIDTRFFEAASRARIVATFSVGLDHVDVAGATRRGVLVTHTPGVLTETCADFTWALLLAAARRVVEGDRLMRAGRYKGWDPLMLLGTDVHGKTLGVVGFGRIGQAVARRAAGFDMRVLYSDVRPVPGAVEADLHAQHVDLDVLLRESDFVCLHTVLDQTTYHLLDARRLRLMKPGAYLINGARGPIIDEQALVRALKDGWIRGAALDVYEREPRMAPGLARQANAVLVPHLASASLETRDAMGRLAAGSIVEYLVYGKVPPNAANPQAAQAGLGRPAASGA